MALSITVRKASMRSPAELVFTGANGMNASQVPFPRTPAQTHARRILPQTLANAWPEASCFADWKQAFIVIHRDH